MDSHEYIIVRATNKIVVLSGELYIWPLYCLAQVNGDIGTVGVSGHAADALGDVVFVELPAVGTEIEAE